MSDNETLPVQDDARSDGPTEQELLDAVMRNSPIMEEAGVPLPDKEIEIEDPVEEEDEDPESSEAVSEEDEEEVEEEGVEEPAGDDASTESELFTADTLDLDAKVAVKIDGEETEVSFGDLIKGYTTEQSLSKKGRELGEARKALDEERATKLEELEKIATATAQQLMNAENVFSKQYHDLEAKIQKARADGDTYDLGELKDKREQAQAKYWRARKAREDGLASVSKQKEDFEAQRWQEQIDHFSKEIPNHIPDFNEDLATKIRDFAVEEGIAEGLLDTVVDPVVIKFIDDYRRLKQGVTKGTAKRKATPAKKAVPAKKGRPPAQKKVAADKAVRDKVLSGKGNKNDEMAFLRQYASKSLNL